MISGENCPKCGLQDYEVYNSRVQELDMRRRSKKCHSCGCRWTTLEVLEGIIEDGELPMRRTNPDPDGTGKT